MFVDGLPLLPCLAGDGSRVLVNLSVDGSVIGGDVDERVSSILTKVGVKVLDVHMLGRRTGGTGVLERGLISAGYVHSGDAVGVMRALSNLVPGGEGGDGDLMTRVKMRFKNVEPSERDMLRRFLRAGLERNEEVTNDEAALRTLKSLPLWETHERVGGKEAYLDLLVDQVRDGVRRGANGVRSEATVTERREFNGGSLHWSLTPTLVAEVDRPKGRGYKPARQHLCAREDAGGHGLPRHARRKHHEREAVLPQVRAGEDSARGRT